MLDQALAMGLLPVAAFKNKIVAMVRNNPVTIITAETGAGKTTGVPQFLYEAGYKVVVTQPRRLAAASVAARVAEEVGCALGDEVGFHTGFERNFSRSTRLLFCTDGLQLVKELVGAAQADVVVVDEIHEGNLAIELLVAWTKKKLKEGWKTKVVLMSATLEADRLSAFFGGAPVITVPGSTFPVEERQARPQDLLSSIQALIREGRNVLVFQPGKAEIEETIKALEGSGAVVLPLHADIEPCEQARCFDSYDRPKVIVGTNIAQTSVTITDIDGVVDSGLERRLETVDGIEGLYLRPISQADCQQRRGRGGRTKRGIYILCGAPVESRPEFPQAEIERGRLDQTVLRLAVAGVDAGTFEFFHQPDPASVIEAKRALRALGALTDTDRVTDIGRKLARLPISVHLGRMILEAEKFNVVGDVLSIAAILDAGSLRGPSGAWRSLTQEKDSDILADLDLWKYSQGMSAEPLEAAGLSAKAVFKAREIRQKLEKALRGVIRDFYSTGDREAILGACISGMTDHVYRCAGDGKYLNGTPLPRRIARESVVTDTPEWIVGLPFDISNSVSGKASRIIAAVNVVKPEWLIEICAHLVTARAGGLFYSPGRDSVMETRQAVFNSHVLAEEHLPVPDHPEASAVLARWLAANEKHVFDNAKRQQWARALNKKAGRDIFPVLSREELEMFYFKALSGAACLSDVERSALLLPPLDRREIMRVLAA